MAWLRCSQGESLSSAALLLALPLLVQQPLAIAPPPCTWMPVVAVNNQREGLYRLTPERQALLATIRYAEGTWKDGSDEGYRTLYGGGRFE
ncbi:MAG: muramidase, partial [Cyanobium sp.]